MLTVKQIDSLKVDKPQYIADGHNLYLRVVPSGRRTFHIRTRINGKAKYEKIGAYPTLSLLAARKLALEFDASLLKAGETVDNFFITFYKHVNRQYEKPEAVEAMYKNDIGPILGKKELKSVTRLDVSKMLDRIVERGAPVQANRTMKVVKDLFEYAVAKGNLEVNPLIFITRKSVGGKEESRTRFLTEDEIKGLIKECLTPRLDESTRGALYLALLTGQRMSNVLGINKKHITGSMWTIPKHLTKTKLSDHKVYLSVQARAALKRISHPIPIRSHQTVSCAIRRLALGWTPHDLRRTMTTHLAGMDVMPHVTEKMLHHKMVGVMAVYNLGEYLKEREVAWMKWGAYIARLRREVLYQMRHPSSL